MNIMISSTRSVLSLASLFNRDAESVQAQLEGRFQQILIKTRDYEISLVTLMNHEGTTGSHYEVETIADEKIRKFQLYSLIETYIDGYMMKLKDVMPVTIAINNIPAGLCNWKKDNVVINGAFTIVEVQDLDHGFARGMVQKKELWQVKKYKFLTT